MQISESQKWSILGTGAAILGAMLARMLLTKGWKGVTRREPPKNPAAPDTSWSEALVWTAAVSLVAGIARLVAQRSAAEAWRMRAGQYPPGLGQERV